MKKHKATPKKDGVEAFAATLRETLAVRGVSRAELARKIKRSPSAVSNYTIGRDVPSPMTVFAIEDALGLSGGYLSRLLGFCRCEEDVRPPGVEEAVLADPSLPPEHKKTLVGLYKGLAVSAIQG